MCGYFLDIIHPLDSHYHVCCAYDEQWDVYHAKSTLHYDFVYKHLELEYQYL